MACDKCVRGRTPPVEPLVPTGCSGFRPWQVDRDGQPVPWRVEELELSARASGEGGGDAEAESGARTVLGSPPETARGASLVVVGQTWTLVGHGELMMGPVLFDGDRDGAAGRGGMQCVVEGVVEDLLDGAWHGADEDWRLSASKYEMHLSEFRCGAPGVDPVSGGACEVHGDRRTALVRSCELQQIGDEAGETLCLGDGGIELGVRWRDSRRSTKSTGGAARAAEPVAATVTSNPSRTRPSRSGSEIVGSSSTKSRRTSGSLTRTRFESARWQRVYTEPLPSPGPALMRRTVPSIT